MRPPKKETSTESGWKDISFKRQWRHQKDIVRREECAKSPIQSCQQEGLPNFRDVKGKPDQEKSVSSDNDVKRKMCQGKRVSKNGAVDSRDNPAVSHRSYRFLLSLKCSPISIHFETSVTRLVRALLVCLYIHIYITHVGTSPPMAVILKLSLAEPHFQTSGKNGKVNCCANWWEDNNCCTCLYLLACLHIFGPFWVICWPNRN